MRTILRVLDLRSQPAKVGGCFHLKPPSRYCRQQQYGLVRILASKDTKKFNARKRASVKAKPAEGGQQADKKVAVVIPPRIDCNSTIPVRRQQRLVQAKKEAEAAATKRVYKQTFRKPKIDPEQRAEEAKKEAENEIARKEDTQKINLASLQNLYGTAGDEHPPILLVDGYNVLFKFVDMIQIRGLTHSIGKASDFEGQREAFQNVINTYSQTRGIKVVIVYDAIYRPTDPVYLDIRTSTRETLPGGVDVVFCSDQSADLWLVREASKLQKEGKTPQVMMATDDGEVISSSLQRGIWSVPSRELVSDILHSERKLERWTRNKERSHGGQSHYCIGGSFMISEEVLAFTRRKLAERAAQKNVQREVVRQAKKRREGKGRKITDRFPHAQPPLQPDEQS